MKTLGVFLFLIGLTTTSFAQVDDIEEQLEELQNDREELHQVYMKSIRYYNRLNDYEYLLKKDIANYRWGEMSRRMRYGWMLGKVEQLKKDIPMYLNTSFYASQIDDTQDWRRVLKFEAHHCSEWTRFMKMSERLHDYFKTNDEQRSAEAMLGVMYQGAIKLDRQEDAKKYLDQLLIAIPKSDERYKYYISALGWWYQDNGLWEESIELFRKRYNETNSINMLSSMVWGLFNAKQYEELVSYESKLWELDYYIMDFILAKSYEALGNSTKADIYWNKFKDQGHTGSHYWNYYGLLEKNKFYYYNQLYMIEVAEHFETSDPAFACEVYELLSGQIHTAAFSNYKMQTRRKVLIAQETEEDQIRQIEKYEQERAELLDLVEDMRWKFDNCQ